MTVTDEQIDKSVNRLADEYSLSDLARRLLHIYFEIILLEVRNAEGSVPVTIDDVETGMEIIANSMLRRQARRQQRSFDDATEELNSSSNKKISAATLFHMADIFRVPSNVYFADRQQNQYFISFRKSRRTGNRINLKNVHEFERFIGIFGWIMDKD